MLVGLNDLVFLQMTWNTSVKAIMTKIIEVDVWRQIDPVLWWNSLLPIQISWREMITNPLSICETFQRDLELKAWLQYQQVVW